VNSKKQIPKPRIAKSKIEVKGSQSYAEFYKGLEERATGPKEKKSWTIHPSEKQWRNDMKGLNPTQRCILIDLRYYARKEDEAWPPISDIAKNLNVSESTIQRHIPFLAKKGFVEIIKTSGRNNLYKLNISF